MALIKVRAFSASETAFILRHELGPIYNWEQRLLDMRRNKPIPGPILLPYAASKHASLYRPMYGPEDIKAFVIAYRAYDHRAQRGVKPQATCLEMDEADYRHWRVRRLSPARSFLRHTAANAWHSH